jgi:hypothetical protein
MSSWCGQRKTTLFYLCLYELVRPVVTYGCEIYVQRDIHEHKLRVFERKEEDKRPNKKNQDWSWRIKTKTEKDLLIKHADVFRYVYITTQRIR